MRNLLFLFSILLAVDAFARLPDLIPYRKGNLWGYCDSTKKIVIEPQWEYSSPFQGATAVVKKNGFYGLIDRTGKATTAFIYTSLEQDSRNGKRIAASGKKKKNVGLIDEKGGVIIPFEYSCIYWETDRYLRAERGASSGEFDSSGRMIIPFDYSTTTRDQVPIYNHSADSGLFIFSNGSGYKFGVVDSNNQVVIPLKYDMVDGIGHGYFWALKHGKQGGPHDSEFVFDRYGKPATWEEIPPRDYRCYRVPDLRSDSASNLYYAGWNDCSTPRKTLHSRKLLYAGFFHSGRAAFMTYDSLCGYVDENFNEVIPAKYGWCSDFTSDFLAQVYALHHAYPRKGYPVSGFTKSYAINRFDVAHRQPLGYIDIHGTEYWEE